MNEVLLGSSKFKEITKYEDIYKININMEDRINYQLRKLKNENAINENEYNELYVSGSSPPIMYGQPKIHKENNPLRPILTAFKAASFRLAKFLINFWQPFTTNQYTLKKLLWIKETIENKNFPPNVVIASFDIASLYTNVPIQETVDIAVNKVCDVGNDIRNMTKQTFKKLLLLCVNDNHIIFNGKYYRQFEGFAMGSPLSAPMAILFLCHHEEQWLHECPQEFKPLLYRRYVDDTFLVFQKHHHLDVFLKYINSKHQNIKFTMEREFDNKISFLDLNISKKQVKIWQNWTCPVLGRKLLQVWTWIFTAVHTSNSRSTTSKHLSIELTHCAPLGPLLTLKLSFYLVILLRILIHFIYFIMS